MGYRASTIPYDGVSAGRARTATTGRRAFGTTVYLVEAGDEHVQARARAGMLEIESLKLTGAAARSIAPRKPVGRSYLDRHGPLVSRLCDSGVRAWAAFGDGKGEVGLTDEERRGLERCPNVELVTIRGSGHLALNDNPGIVAGLILDAAKSVSQAPSWSS
jgi:pimeloyl-ACP methyl ester carboxylesterase